MSDKIKICIVGSRGMLGQMVYRYLSQNPIFEIDVANRGVNRDGTFGGRIQYNWEKRYNFLINCAGMIKYHIKDDSYEDIENAIESNITLPYELSRLRNYDYCLNIATDCVYSGLFKIDEEYKSYIETDKHNCLDVYGKTKSLGEIKKDNWKNIRVSIVGPEWFGAKKSLLEWFLRHPIGARINGYINAYWNGVSTLEYAKILERIMLNDIAKDMPNLVHLWPYEQITKAKLISEFRVNFREDLYINCIEAPETIYRVLGTKYPELNRRLIGCNELSIEEMIRDLKPYITEERFYQ